MSKLRETNWQGIKGWQWDCGPIFVGDDGRQWALDYGQAVQRIEELTKLAKLHQEQVQELKRPTDQKQWRFHWLNGKVEVGIGDTVSEAFTQLGYGAGAMAAMDHYQELE